MVNLYENIAIDGAEFNNIIFSKDLNNQLVDMSFFEVPDPLSNFNIEDCIKFPILIKDKISICNVFMFRLNPNIDYKISGRYIGSKENINIYLSEVNTNKTLRESVIYTLTNEDLQAEGLFIFPNIYQYNSLTTLAAWIEIDPDPNELGRFHATATALTAAGNFMFEVRDKALEIEPDLDKNLEWEVTAEGRINLKLNEPVSINLTTLYYDGTIPDSYYEPPDDNYNIEEAILEANVNKGIYELQQGILIPSANNKDFQIFISSLTTLGGNSLEIDSSSLTYELTTSWGKYNESNRVIVWISSEQELFGNFTIEECIEPAESENGLTWTVTCLSGDTLITMSDNSKKRMDEIKIGDKILAENNQIDTVYEVRRGIFTPYHILYYFDNGVIIDETHDHRFYNKTQGFWQRLKLWNLGDIALCENETETALIKKEIINEKVENFGIFTYGGTYYANGLLSGAARCNKKFIANASTEQAIDMMLSIDEYQLLNLFGVKEELL